MTEDHFQQVTQPVSPSLGQLRSDAPDRMPAFAQLAQAPASAGRA